MKKGTKIAAVMMIGGMLFLLSSCGTKKYKLQEKYYTVSYEERHYEFSEDGTYAITYDDDKYTPHMGTYTFGEEGENTLRMFDDEIAEGYQFVGEVYEDCLCEIWNGRLPQKYEDAKISYAVNDLEGRLYISYYFYEDGTYDFLSYKEDYVTKNRELFVSQKGVYKVENGKVVCTCTSVEGEGEIPISGTSLFMANGKVYNIVYVAE